MSFLPYGRHSIDEDDIEAVVDVLRHGALTCGPKVAEFEAAFANKVGTTEAVSCSNGTTALHLAVMAAGLGKGDIAIVPSVTFLSTANAVRMVGADVIFADVDAETGLLSEATLAKAFGETNKRVTAVLPVHLNGQCVEMEAVAKLAEEHDSQIITDCCHALGAEYNAGGRPGDGRFEGFGCFSLHPVKSIAMGEGGMVTTNNTEHGKRMRLLRGHDMKRDSSSWLNNNLGFDSNGDANPWYYEMHELAYNYRATDIQCALGLSQLSKLNKFIARRRAIAARYDELLGELSGWLRPVRRTKIANSAWHLYPVLIEFEKTGKDRAQVMRELQASGVGTQVHYIPVHMQPYYRQRYGEQDLPGAMDYYNRVLSLPIFPAMTDEDVAAVVAALKGLISK